MDRTGQQLGHYRLTRLLGQGGFAEVYLAEHIHLGTETAIKVLHTHLPTEDMEAFRTEARTIARLKHLHIIRVLDFGFQNNIPYLVMDYAPIGTLRHRHPKGSILDLETIVLYVKQIAEALHYAHENKLIHRDVKPENMLLGEQNKVLLSDFGIAVVAQTSRHSYTQDVVGTITYMAPEQIQAHPRPASDQYALGIVVYEWLSGERPFTGTFTEIATKHCLTPPPPLREKRPDLSPIVEQVVLTALAKDPKQRFTNILAFATALEQASTTPYHRPSSPLSSMGDVTAADNTLVQVPLQEQLKPSFEGAPEPPKDIPELLHSARQTPLPPSSSSLKTQTTSTHSEHPPAGVQGQAPVRKISRRLILIGSIVVGLVGIGGSSIWVAASSARGKLITTYQGHSSAVNSVAWSPDGKRIASASNDATVQVWDATNGDNSFTYRRHTDVVNGVAWSPDGKRIASSSNDKTVQIWNAADGGHLYTYQGHEFQVNSAVWSPDSQLIASAGFDALVQVWIADNGNRQYTYNHHQAEVRSVAWSPDSKRIASASTDGIVNVWDATNGTQLFTYQGHKYNVNSIVWSPDSKRIASGSDDITVQVWNASDGSNPFTYQGHSGFVESVAWSPDSRHIASGSADQTVRVWDAADGSNSFIYHGHHATVHSVAWSLESKCIASASDDNTVQSWNASDESNLY